MKKIIEKYWPQMLGPLTTIAFFIIGITNVFIFIVFILYSFMIIVYMSYPWKYKTWEIATDDEAENLRKMIISAHNALLVLLFIIPLLYFGYYYMLQRTPQWIDTISAHALSQRNSLKELPCQSLKLDTSEATPQNQEATFIGSVDKEKITVTQTKTLLQIALAHYMPDAFPYTLIGALFITLFTIAIRMAEIFAGKSFFNK
jgi:hypothetical protein